MDPPPWCDAAMRLTLPNVHSFQLPDPSWEWVSPRWLIDMTLDVDDDGWQYASRFAASTTWHSRHSASRSFVRRRRWLRLRRRPHPPAGDAASPLCGAGHCLVEGPDPTSPVRRCRSRAPKDMATKIKCKISRNYVGTSPKGPLAHTSAPRTYTLKDGQYRSHRTRGAVRPATPPPSPSLSPAQGRPHPLQRISFVDDADAGSRARLSGPALEQLQLGLSLAGVGARPQRRRLSSGEQSLSSSTATHERIREALLALPTGGMRAPHGQPAPSHGREADGDEQTVDGYVAGVPKHFPRLTSLMSPEPTVPFNDDGGGGNLARTTSRMLGEYLPTDDSDAAAVDSKRARPSRLRVWGGLPSRAGSAVALSQSAPASPDAIRTQILADSLAHPMPVPPSSPADGNADLDDTAAVVVSPVSPPDAEAASTAAASHLSLVIGGGGGDARIRRSQTDPASPMSLEFSRASSISTESFHRGESPQLHPYVDPYASRDLALLPDTRGAPGSAGGAAPVHEAMAVDKAVVALASEALCEMVGEVALDRERLDVVHECLRLGGIPAAAVWYSLPWLHYDALQYDSARQRLIALLLANAHTCPPDALSYFASARCTRQCDEALLMRSMSAYDRDELRALTAAVACGPTPVLTLSQAWRLVVRPLVAQDADLFYSDFKRMLVGVARWSLTAKQRPPVAAALA
ncbi:hypothetical protein IWQ56_000306 [Coemansia nantahalensis]|nr:hypothetical protein IWQ56_000306 [Coemansia nantahalensis]